MKKLRKSMALLLAMAMVLATFGITVVSAAAFSDTSGHWAESVIDKWSNANVINGYEDGTFLPLTFQERNWQKLYLQQNSSHHLLILISAMFQVMNGLYQI